MVLQIEEAKSFAETDIDPGKMVEVWMGHYLENHYFFLLKWVTLSYIEKGKAKLRDRL